MKKLNARRFVAIALALLMILPAVSIPTFASDTSQTSLTSGAQTTTAAEALFSQNFEAFDTLKGPVTPSSGVLNGPRSAQVIAAGDSHGNVLQINCQATADDGRYWICFNGSNNYWVQINNVITERVYYHPSSADGIGANVSGVDFTGAADQTPIIHTGNYVYIADGTVKTPGDVTYRVRGLINLDSCKIECKFYSSTTVATDYEGVPAYEYEYEPLYMYEYDYKYEYEYEYEYKYETDEDGNFKLDDNGEKIPVLGEDGKPVYKLDGNGNPIVCLDEKGNAIYKLDEFGQKIHVLDEEGNYKYLTDSNGNRIPNKDASGNMIILKDEKGNNLVYRYEYEYELEYETNDDGSFKLDEDNNKIPKKDEDGNLVYKLDGEGKKIPVLDEEGNPVYKLDDQGNKVYSLEGEGERVPLLTPAGETIPLRYPNGDYVPLLDAEGNIVYKLDEEGNKIPLKDETGNPVYQYDEIGMKIPKLDEEGKIVYLEGELTDAKGRKVYQEIPLEEINYRGVKQVEVTDANGNVLYEPAKTPKLDANGNPVLDSTGNPKMEIVKEPALDENGNQIYVETGNMVDRLDENGNVVYFEKQVVVYETDSEGNFVLDGEGNKIPVKVQATTAVRDENDQVIYQYVYDGNGDAEAAAPRWEIQYEADGVTPKLDAGGNPLEYWVYPAVGKPVLQQQTDEDGNPLYDAYGNPLMEYKKERLLTKRYKADGTPQMMVKTEVQLVPYQDKEVVKAPDVVVMVPVTEEQMTVPVTSLYIANFSLIDAFGGGYNVAREAYIQAGTINSDLLIFSTDYYFSEDMTHGMDIRITATAEDGTDKAFNFVSINTPDHESGTVEITGNSGAQTFIVRKTKKVPLGTWCNIIIVADFTSGTSALYVNGELVSVKQDTNITEQEIDKEVIVNSQTVLYEYIPGEYEPLKDEKGNVVMTKQLDENGNPVMRLKHDEEGDCVYNEITGDHEYEYMMVPVMVPKVKRDEAGDPIVVMTDKLDEEGNIVYKEVYDRDGNIVLTEQRDANGNVVMLEVVDADGNFVKNSDGTIKKEAVMIPQMVPVQIPVTTDKYVNVYGEDGVLETQLLRDADGNIVKTQREGLDGTTGDYAIMVPVEEVVTEVQLDADGNPVTEKVTAMAPATNTWTMPAKGIKAGTWNLGHFLRGGKVSDYKGYMYVDNIAIYNGKDLDKVFASKGYALDYNETYEGFSIGDIVKLDGKDTNSAVVSDPAGSEDQVLQINYDDEASINTNYAPATEGFSYVAADKVVLEANYYLKTGSAGKIHSQFWYMGAQLDVPDSPFAFSNVGGNTPGKSRQYPWIELYTIQTGEGASKATVASHGAGTKKVEIELDKWYAFSMVIDLDNGEYTLYINGVSAFEGRLCKNLTDVDGQSKNFYFRDISVGTQQWIVSKIDNGASTPRKGSFYVDDVTVTKLGGERASMKRIGGLLTADICANGTKIKTVTDENYFFCSDLITLENVEIYDIGIDQLLKTDDESIRYTSPSGIRFTTWVDMEALNKLYENIKNPPCPDKGGAAATDDGEVSLKAVSFGTLIIPTDLLDDADLTFEDLEANNLPYLDVKGSKGNYYDVDGDGVGTHIAGSIINIKEDNIDRFYSAVSYVRIVLETGVVYNIYGHRVAKTSAQSLADDEFGTHTPAEQAVIDAFLAGKKPAADFPSIVDDSTSN